MTDMKVRVFNLKGDTFTFNSIPNAMEALELEPGAYGFEDHVAAQVRRSLQALMTLPYGALPGVSEVAAFEAEPEEAAPRSGKVIKLRGFGTPEKVMGQDCDCPVCSGLTQDGGYKAAKAKEDAKAAAERASWTALYEVIEEHAKTVDKAIQTLGSSIEEVRYGSGTPEDLYKALDTYGQAVGKNLRALNTVALVHKVFLG